MLKINLLVALGVTISTVAAAGAQCGNVYCYDRGPHSYFQCVNGQCQIGCDSGYVYNSGSNTCVAAVPNNTVGSCGASNPQVCAGPVNGNGYPVCNAGGPNSYYCSIQCNSGFNYNQARNSCDAQVPRNTVASCGNVLPTVCGGPANGNGYPVCLQGGGNGFFCSIACDNGFVFDSKTNTCNIPTPNNTIDSCGNVNPVKCTTNIQNSYPICSAGGSNGFQCGALCNSGYKYDPPTNTCNLPAPNNTPDSCGNVNPAKCTSDIPNSHPICISGGNNGYQCSAACNDSYSYNPAFNSCDANTCPSGFALRTSCVALPAAHKRRNASH